MGRLFGSSGIRGPYGDAITVDLALRLGSETGAMTRRLLVGHDARITSPVLARAFLAGALASGAHVDFAGGVATPSLAYAARGYDAGVVVTASHNPPADNGFKFWNPDGSAWDPAQEQALELRLQSPSAARPPWQKVRAERTRSDVAQEHISAILGFAGTLRDRVVVDCGNGAGAWVTPALFREAGSTVDVLDGEPDGRFPNRSPEPTEESLAALRMRCERDGGWGIAHDGDADRMVPVDPHGRVVPAERVLVALAILLRARRIVTPVDCSLALQAALPDATWYVCRVGDAAVSARLRELKADLGGETSGTYIVPRFDYAPDGPLAALLFLQAASQGLAEVAEQRLRPVVRRSEKVPLDPALRPFIPLALNEVEPKEGERATRVDGLRIDAEAGWLLIRPSGTEPFVRVTAEAWETQDAEALLDRGRQLAKAVLKTAAMKAA